MSIVLSSETDPIATISKVDSGELPGPLSKGGIKRWTGFQREHDKARGAVRNKENIKILNLGEYIPSLLPIFFDTPTLELEALEDLGRDDPLAASLPSVVARSDCHYSTSVIRPAEKQKVKTNVDAYLEKILRTWEEERELPLGGDKDSVANAKMFEYRTSTTPSLERGHKIVPALRTRKVAEVHVRPPKLGLEATVQLFNKVLGES